MLAGHWPIFRGAGHFPHNLLMFCRFLVSDFHVINLSDVSRSLDGFQMYGAFSIQPADVQQVTGQFFGHESQPPANLPMFNRSMVTLFKYKQITGYCFAKLV